MKTEDTLYIKILVWAYNKQENGFAWEELKKEFNLTPEQNKWALKVFHPGTNLSGDNLIDFLPYNENDKCHTYVITAKGTSAAIEYLNLKGVEKSSRRAEIIAERAERIALIAIIIGVVVGAIQIIVDLFGKNVFDIIKCVIK